MEVKKKKNIDIYSHGVDNVHVGDVFFKFSQEKNPTAVQEAIPTLFGLNEMQI